MSITATQETGQKQLLCTGGRYIEVNCNGKVDDLTVFKWPLYRLAVIADSTVVMYIRENDNLA